MMDSLGLGALIFFLCKMAGFDAVTVEAIFTLFCYATAMFNSALSLLPTYASCKRRALGPGGRLPDPIVAALLANAAWCAFGKIEKSKEAIWINVPGVLAQLLNLVTYAVLCNHGERVGLLKRLGYAAAYLAFIVWVGNMPGNVELFKVYCTLAGIAAAGVPWFITVYVTEPKTIDILPHWAVSAFSIVNGVAWAVRGFKYIWNVPMAFQNGVGAFCSFWLLALLYKWRKQPENKYPPLIDRRGTSKSSDNETSDNETSDSDNDTKNKSPDGNGGDSDNDTKKKSIGSPSASAYKDGCSNIRDDDDERSTADSQKTPMDVKKELGDNGAAPITTSPAPAPAAPVSAPAAAEAEIVEEAEAKIDVKEAEAKIDVKEAEIDVKEAEAKIDVKEAENVEEGEIVEE